MASLVLGNERLCAWMSDPESHRAFCMINMLMTLLCAHQHILHMREQGSLTRIIFDSNPYFGNDCCWFENQFNHSVEIPKNPCSWLSVLSAHYLTFKLWDAARWHEKDLTKKVTTIIIFIIFKTSKEAACCGSMCVKCQRLMHGARFVSFK